MSNTRVAELVSLGFPQEMAEAMSQEQAELAYVGLSEAHGKAVQKATAEASANGSATYDLVEFEYTDPNTKKPTGKKSARVTGSNLRGGGFNCTRDRLGAVISVLPRLVGYYEAQGTTIPLDATGRTILAVVKRATTPAAPAPGTASKKGR